MSTALVTGAASGMGAAVAKRLAGDGHIVVCADLNPEGAAQVASGLPGARAEAADITDPASVAALIASCGDDLEVAVHAAGVLSSARLLDLSLEDFDRIIAVNLRGTFIVAQAAARALRDNGGGAIVLFASIEAIRPVHGHAHYAASKAGVVALAQAFAAELAKARVRVNAVAPGLIRTGMTDALIGTGELEALERRVPMGRAGDADEVASVCSFLCSPAASYVTGVCWQVDGGTLIKSPF
jgi:3-oxoacyl-[acyl-carrier protein] reductase